MHIFEVSFFAIQIAPTWYWLMYALGFIICYRYVLSYGYVKKSDMESLLLYIFLGVILGWRLGYVLLYDLSYFIDHSGEILKVWKWGMSFHGGAIGVIMSIVVFAKVRGYRIFDISDVLVSILPIALGLGRMGNYINGELLWYTPYTWAFAIIRDRTSYFPSTLLEAGLEGIFLLILMQLYRLWEGRNNRIPGISSAIFLLWYGLVRIVSEFFRLPDIHIGYLFDTDWMTLGMIYTLPMIIGGIYILYYSLVFSRRRAEATLTSPMP